MAFESVARVGDRVREVSAVVVLDQVADGLGVRLGLESMAAADQFATKFGEVLDDPVDRDGQRPIAGQERMRIFDGCAAVRRPARVSDAAVGADPGPVHRVGEFGYRTGRPHALESRSRTVADHEAHSRRVVAAVLEALETLEQQRTRQASSRVCNDAADFALPLGYRPR